MKSMSYKRKLLDYPNFELCHAFIENSVGKQRNVDENMAQRLVETLLTFRIYARNLIF